MTKQKTDNFNFATMETEKMDYETQRQQERKDIAVRTTKSGLRIYSDTYAVRTGITFPRKPMTEREKTIYSDLHINREYSPGMLKPFLRSVNSLVRKGYLKKYNNKYGIEVYSK